MKEYQKLLYEDVKRQENEKAQLEVKLGLFEQKKVETFDFTGKTLITYGKKYKGLYDLYQDDETLELTYVCPLVEDNKGDEQSEKLNLTPYAYDVLVLELLGAEEYALVKKAAAHEKTGIIDVMYKAAYALYFVLAFLTVACVIALIITQAGLTSILLVCGPLFSALVTGTIILPLLSIQYRKFKAE